MGPMRTACIVIGQSRSVNRVKPVPVRIRTAGIIRKISPPFCLKSRMLPCRTGIDGTHYNSCSIHSKIPCRIRLDSFYIPFYPVCICLNFGFVDLRLVQLDDFIFVYLFHFTEIRNIFQDILRCLYINHIDNIVRFILLYFSFAFLL